MGKRSSFARRPMDQYSTPYKAVLPLLPHLVGVTHFAEPCCGDYALVKHLEKHGLRCVYAEDIRHKYGQDAFEYCGDGCPDAIITNPPWTRSILHPMIKHFQSLEPTWLLFDADWCHTKQAAPFLDQCSHIVSVGRLQWIEGSKNTGKDNASWYRFHIQHSGGPRFIGPMMEAA